MKKQIIKICIMITAAVFTLTSCSALDTALERANSVGDERLKIDMSAANNTRETIISALDSGDKELFKSIFSEQTISLADDLDTGIDYIFDLYEGEYVETIYTNQSAETFPDSGSAAVWPVMVLKTTEKCYFFAWTEWTEREILPSGVGVYSLYMKECEEDYVSGGNGPYLIGVEYPERVKYEELVEKFSCSLDDDDYVTFKTLLADDYLANDDAMSRTDNFIDKNDPEYTNMHAIWKRDDMIFVHQRHLERYFALKLDEQTNKISSIRVFDGEEMTEDSIMDHDYSQDKADLYNWEVTDPD